MDNYDIVIEKTVKDLFRSSTLVQIKKYKLSKETLIQKKEEELKKMILDKYPVLIDSINSLQQISMNLNDLKDIRKNFKSNITRLEELEYNSKDAFIYNIVDEDSESEIYDIEEDLDKCYDMLNSGELESLIIKLIRLKGSDINKYDSILVDLMEVLMKKFFEVSIYNEKEEIEFYVFAFFSIFYLINDTDMLNYLQFYLKLENDVNVAAIYNDIIGSNGNESKDNLEQYSLIMSFNVIIKISLLKISKNLADLGGNAVNDNDYILLYRNIYFMIFLLTKLTSSNDYVVDSEDEGLKFSNKFTLNDMLSYIQTIFSINEIRIASVRHSSINEFIEFITNETSKLTFSHLEIRKLLAFCDQLYSNTATLRMDEEIRDYRLFDITLGDNLLKVVNKLITTEFDKFNNPSIRVEEIKLNNLIVELDRTKDNSFIHKVQNILVTALNEFLVRRTKGVMFTNTVVLYLFQTDIKHLILKFSDEEIKKEFEILSEEYIHNQYDMLEDYMKEINELLELESYEDVLEEGFTNTLNELTTFLKHHYKFHTIDIGYSETHTVKHKLLNIIIANFKNTYDSVKNRLYNKKIINDLDLLITISRRYYQTDITIEGIDGGNDNIRHKIVTFFGSDLDIDIDSQVTNFWTVPNFKQRDPIPFDKKLNNFIIGYKKTRCSDKQEVSLRSTKLLEFKIETNNLSINQNAVPLKKETQRQVDQMTTNVKSYFSFFQDKLTQGVNNIQNYVNKDS
jgi:hypothetical protein